jgi:hypothetical protein
MMPLATQGHGWIAAVKQPQGLHAIVECRPARHHVLGRERLIAIQHRPDRHDQHPN